MALNYVQEGEVLDLAAPYAVASGAGALIGSVFGVALTTLANSAIGPFARSGVFDLTALSTATGAVGAKVYWDDSNKRVDTNSTVGMLIGALTVAKLNAETTARVTVNCCVPSASEGPQAAIADLALTTLTDTPATADALRDNLTSTWEAEIEAKVNAILAALRAAGTIAAA